MKKSKLKLKNKQKQKQKQKQSIIVNIDNSRKTAKRDGKQSQQPKQPSVIPQPIYIPSFNYALPPPAPFREEPVRPPVFNPATVAYNPPAPALAPAPVRRPLPLVPVINNPAPIVPQQVQPVVPVANTPLMTPQPKQKSFVPQPLIPPPAQLVSSKGLVKEMVNKPSHSTFGKSPFYNEDEDTNDYRLPFMPFNNNDEITNDMYEPQQNISNYDDDEIMRPLEIPDTPPTINNVKTCPEIIQSGLRKGQVCGKKCILNSPFCGIHKNSNLQFNKPMEKYVVRK